MFSSALWARDSRQAASLLRPRSLAFSADSSELWALASADNRLDRFEIVYGGLLQSVPDLHRLAASVLAVDPRGRFVVTTGQVRICLSFEDAVGRILSADRQ